MDQGVITNLKMCYRKQILKRLINPLENEKPEDNVADLRMYLWEQANV